VRDRWLKLSDRALLDQCEYDRFRASGPGGQKRNKTESAVRLRHAASGVFAVATESRSQHENRERALRRLREKLALDVREPVDVEAYRPPAELSALIVGPAITAAQRRSAAYLIAAGQLLDLFAAARGSVRDTAARLGLGSAVLSKLLYSDPRVLRRANDVRLAHGLKPLRC
jgi:hypothetical protein